MRYFAYLYHGLLALFLLGITFLAIVSGSHTLRLEMLPWWKGAALTYWVFFGALFGLATVFLAVKGTLRALFLLWSAVVMALMVKGYVFSPFFFERGDITTTIWLMVGAFLALAGAWFQLQTRPVHNKKLY